MNYSKEHQKLYNRKSGARFGAALVLAVATVATASTISVFSAGEANAARVCIIVEGIRICGEKSRPGNGGGGGGRDRVIRPKPPAPARLPVTLRTNERVDVIEVSGRSGNGKGKVRICLQTGRGMWKKRLYIQRQYLNSENGQADCDVFATGQVRIALIKAKFAGKLEHVGIRRINLTGWGGGQVTIRWIRD